MTSSFPSVNSVCVAMSCLLWINEEPEGVKLSKTSLQKGSEHSAALQALALLTLPWWWVSSVAPALCSDDSNSPEVKLSFAWVSQVVPLEPRMHELMLPLIQYGFPRLELLKFRHPLLGPLHQHWGLMAQVQ